MCNHMLRELGQALVEVAARALESGVEPRPRFQAKPSPWDAACGSPTPEVRRRTCSPGIRGSFSPTGIGNWEVAREQRENRRQWAA